MRSDLEYLEEKKTEEKRNKICAIAFCVVFVIAITGGLLLYYLLPKKVDPPEPPKPTPPPYRAEPLIRCDFDVDNIQQNCEALGCVWKEMAEPDAPSCQFPAGYGYALMGEPEETALGYDFILSRVDKPSLFGGDIQTVRLEVEFHTDAVIRLKFKDNDTDRYEIPEEALPVNAPFQEADEDFRVYNISWTTEPQFGIAVFRKDNGVVVFNTSVPGMVFADQFLQLTTKLPSGNVYGFGEHNHRRLHHDLNWKTWSIFTRDVAPVDAWNLYGAQPFYLNLEEDGKANGVFLRNSNAMDIILQPDPHPAISYRVIGGVLDFFVFVGESPEEVVQLYTGAVGRPLMPPYWSLGFQLSRWDYGNLSNVQEVVDRNREAKIPQDVQFGDIDYMFKKVDFTYDKENYDGLPEFIDELHSRGQRYIVILDHALAANESLLEEAKNNSLGFDAYEDGVERSIFIKDPNGTEPLFAEVWPGLAVYPDFTNASSQGWWTKWCKFLYEDEDIKFDGLWIEIILFIQCHGLWEPECTKEAQSWDGVAIQCTWESRIINDMNEPSSFVPGSIDGCEENAWNNPPYAPKILGAGNTSRMYDKTICMDSIQEMGLHYNVHNLYGHTMSMRTFGTLEEMFPGKRPFAMTRSNFAGTQKYAIHWLGDNQSLWEQIPWSIIAMLEYSIFGFSMTGSDICGFWYGTDEEMCTRWTQLGAFYPYSRNHNAMGWPDQDPAAFSDNMVRTSRSILQTRYKFLPYLYTLLHHAHVMGSTVARPLFFEFPTDKIAWKVDKQFMWGSGFLISPAMNKGQNKVDAYFPNARWFDYFTAEEVKGTGKRHILDTPLNKINLHVKGGSIIPWQEPDNTTVYSRERPMGLLVALDESEEAIGNLFWDDGESADTYQKKSYLFVEFTVDQSTLQINPVHSNYTGANELYFKTIDIFGLSHKPSRVTVNGKPVEPHRIVGYNTQGKGVQITNQMLNITERHSISWEVY